MRPGRISPDPSPSDHRLIIRDDLRLVEMVRLQGEALTIGRSSGCDITLAHEAVSRHHARLERRPEGWHVIDTNSVHGVLLNGQPISEARVAPGDVIEIRPYRISYIAGGIDRDDRSVTLADSAAAAATIVQHVRSPGVVIKQRLDDLYALARLVIGRKDNGSFWEQMHAALQRCLTADRCVLAGVDESAGMSRLAPRRAPSGRDAPLQISRSVVAQVVETKVGLLIQCVSQHRSFAAAESLVGSAVGSVICAPVVVGGRTRAIAYAERKVSRPAFKPEDLDFAVAAADLAATSVEIDELQATARELARIKGRIDAAREFQEMLLPSPIPQPRWGKVAALNRPAEQISGDVFDVVVDPSGRLIVMIADVSGKGVPAAFITAILQNTFRQAVRDHQELGAVVERMNAAMGDYRLSGCFATMLICRWTPGGEAVEIANAGHHAPLWVTSRGKVEAFPERLSLPLGIWPQWSGPTVQLNISGYPLMLLYSDGALEARDPQGNEYGLSRLSEQLAQLADREPEAVVTALAEAVENFNASGELRDDVTLVAIKMGD